MKTSYTYMYIIKVTYTLLNKGSTRYGYSCLATMNCCVLCMDFLARVVSKTFFIKLIIHILYMYYDNSRSSLLFVVLYYKQTTENSKTHSRKQQRNKNHFEDIGYTCSVL